MPARLEFKIVSKSDVNVWACGGRAVYAVFMNLVSAVNPNFAEKLHADGPSKPFTAGIFCPMKKVRGKLVIPAHRPFTLIMSGLSSDVETGLKIIADYLATYKPPVSFGDAQATMVPNRDDSIAFYYASNRELLECADDAKKTGIEFVTPTAFRRFKEQVLLPEPSLVFKSLARKWNAHGDPGFPIDEKVTEAPISIQQYRLETRMLEFGSFRQLGFTGDVVFNLRRLSSNERCLINMLANYSFFAGVGAKTTMGMGQCRPINPDFKNLRDRKNETNTGKKSKNTTGKK